MGGSWGHKGRRIYHLLPAGSKLVQTLLSEQRGYGYWQDLRGQKFITGTDVMSLPSSHHHQVLVFSRVSNSIRSQTARGGWLFRPLPNWRICRKSRKSRVLTLDEQGAGYRYRPEYISWIKIHWEERCKTCHGLLDILTSSEKNEPTLW